MELSVRRDDTTRLDSSAVRRGVGYRPIAFQQRGEKRDCLGAKVRGPGRGDGIGDNSTRRDDECGVRPVLPRDDTLVELGCPTSYGKSSQNVGIENERRVVGPCRQRFKPTEQQSVMP